MVFIHENGGKNGFNYSSEVLIIRKSKEKTDYMPGRNGTQVGANLTNVIDNGDGQLLPTLYYQIHNSTGLDYESLGYITGVRSLLQSLTTPLWGLWSDRHSRKNLLAFGCFLWGIFTLLNGFGSTFVYMITIRLFTGISLAIIVPTTQSLLSDYFPPDKRGKAFGWLGLTGVVGVVFGTIYATLLVTIDTDLDAWRWVFITWGIISFVIAGLVLVLVKEPVRGGVEPELANLLASKKIKEPRAKFKSYVKIFTNGTFWLIVAQGVSGSIPWNGILFMVTWFQYMGFDALTSGLMFAIIAIGSALGNLIGGVLGDRAEKWRPNSGRIIICQISVASGIPLLFVIFFLIPMSTASLVSYLILGFITGIFISWCGPQNTTIFSQIFEPEIRSMVYSVDRLFEGSAAALGTVLVTLVATSYGLSDTASNVVNANALAWGMFLVALIPWIICLIVYTLVYLTYPKDIAKARAIIKAQAEEAEAKSE
ncbi:MAG TPA: MFS transporter [Candidatus Lokiarchaeia archaeon]|nr:MFS transporter [Candidatus Lokiarchaeia archaeon]